jgi:hypothetical protein
MKMGHAIKFCVKSLKKYYYFFHKHGKQVPKTTPFSYAFSLARLSNLKIQTLLFKKNLANLQISPLGSTLRHTTEQLKVPYRAAERAKYLKQTLMRTFKSKLKLSLLR